MYLDVRYKICKLMNFCTLKVVGCNWTWFFIFSGKKAGIHSDSKKHYIHEVRASWDIPWCSSYHCASFNKISVLITRHHCVFCPAAATEASGFISKPHPGHGVCFYALFDRRRLRLLTVIKPYTRECLGICVGKDQHWAAVDRSGWDADNHALRLFLPYLQRIDT